jgi:alcohol dehydrogenase class IV
MRFNLSSRRAEFAMIADALAGRATSSCPPSERVDELAQQAIERVESLQTELGIRTRLRDLGLAHESLPQVAAKAYAIKRLMETNPRTPTEPDLVAILEAAY